MLDITEIVFEAGSGGILREGTLSEVLKKIEDELQKAGKNESTPMRIVIRIGA